MHFDYNNASTATASISGKRIALAIGIAAALIALQWPFKQVHAGATPSGTTGTTGSATAQSFYATPFEKKPDAAALTDLGRALFSDTTLSASGRMSCASCHKPRATENAN